MTDFRNGYDEHHLEAIEEHKDQAIIDPTNIADLGHHDDLGVTKQVSYYGLRLVMSLWMVMMVSACGRRTLDHGVRQEFLGPGVRGVVHVLHEHTLDAFLRWLAPVCEELKVVS